MSTYLQPFLHFNVFLLLYQRRLHLRPDFRSVVIIMVSNVANKLRRLVQNDLVICKSYRCAQKNREGGLNLHNRGPDCFDSRRTISERHTYRLLPPSLLCCPPSDHEYFREALGAHSSLSLGSSPAQAHTRKYEDTETKKPNPDDIVSTKLK